MRALRKQGIAFVLVAACLTSTSAFAQFELPQLSVSEMVQRSSGQLKEMDSVIQAAFDSLEQARSDEDLQRISCINDALTAMKGLLKLAEENMLSLRENAARSDRESAEFEHMKISIASDKFVELDAQVRSCGGPAMDGSIDGRPVVNKIFNDDLPEADPADSFKNTEVLLERPPSASVFN
jgi:anaerobic selenocysteine-containing dehydrogenase